MPDLLTLWLERGGYIVRRVSDGEEAVQVISEGPVRLVIADLWLHRPDGRAMLGSMCEKLKHVGVPVLIVTRRSAEVLSERCPSMAAFLQRPFTQAVLISTVQNAIERHKPRGR